MSDPTIHLSMEHLLPRYDEKQVAELLGVSVRTLQNWRYEGRGGPAYVKVGANVRYTGQALIDFIAAHTVTMREVA